MHDGLCLSAIQSSLPSLPRLLHLPLTSSIPLSLSSSLFRPSLHASLAHSSLSLSSFSLLNPTSSPCLPSYLHFLLLLPSLYLLVENSKSWCVGNQGKAHQPIYLPYLPNNILHFSFILSLIFMSLQQHQHSRKLLPYFPNYLPPSVHPSILTCPSIHSSISFSSKTTSHITREMRTSWL